MRDVIVLLLSNFTLTLLVVGLAASAISLLLAPKPLTGGRICEALLFYFIFFSIGVSNLYNFVMHTAFSEMTARFIGWADSPFQLEVGFASLGFSLVGFLACWRSFDMRLAAILGPACFLWGAAGVHVHQMIAAHNFAPGNAGVVFWTDIFTPVIGFVLLWLHCRSHAGARP
ncbi:DUF6790 family protein [Camelimonas sp. ID_303_24]